MYGGISFFSMYKKRIQQCSLALYAIAAKYFAHLEVHLPSGGPATAYKYKKCILGILQKFVGPMPPVAPFSATWPSPTDPSDPPLFEPMPTRHGCSRRSSRSRPRPLNPCKSPGSTMQGIFRCCIATPDRRPPPSGYHKKKD